MLLNRSTIQNQTMIGNHPAVLEVRRMARRMAQSEFPVLITGETGTGKEVLAREIHATSCRDKGPFVVVDCGVLSRDLARSELFGHLRGAFTGAVEARPGMVETARGGTLFLDEIGELDTHSQRHLLRLLQEGEYLPVGEVRMRESDVRLVAATHRDLRQQVAEGQFRGDLYYRLSVLPLHLPPLRERKGDIPLLLGHFLRQYGEESELDDVLSPEALAKLEGYEWTGNIRELKNVVARLLVLSRDGKVDVTDLPPRIRGVMVSESGNLFLQPYKEAWKRSLEAFNREYFHRVLLRTHGNVTRAAKLSGLKRQYFQVRLKTLGLQAEIYRRK